MISNCWIVKKAIFQTISISDAYIYVNNFGNHGNMHVCQHMSVGFFLDTSQSKEC